jgi:triosephosphate isomerase
MQSHPKKLMVGNWKMNHGLSSIESFFSEWFNYSQEKNSQEKNFQEKNSHEVWLAPQFIHMPQLISYGKQPIGFKNKLALKVGAQNCAAEASGAFTGEVSAVALKELGAHFVIIGHSERRKLFHESHETLYQKVQMALKHNLHVIFCVGETLQEREQNRAKNVVQEQIELGLKGLINETSLDQILIAYEPVWAIGTGLTASEGQAQEMHSFIRGLVKEGRKILYGGSVNTQNVKGLYSQKDIDGVLVGGASLKFKDFIQLID